MGTGESTSVCPCAVACTGSGDITTVAGNGTMGSGTNGGLAICNGVYFPIGINVDNKGNIFIADQDYYIIREVTASDGIMHTIGGTFNTPGYSGDKGLASSATFAEPCGVAADNFGNVYVVDRQPNNAIRKIDASGIITTIAGTGTAGYNGDGIPASNARLSDPFSVAVDNSGNIYIFERMSYIMRSETALKIVAWISFFGTLFSAYFLYSGVSKGLCSLISCNSGYAFVSYLACFIVCLFGLRNKR